MSAVERLVPASMLSARMAAYGLETPPSFAAVDPAIAAEATRDARQLTATPRLTDEPVSVARLPLPPTPTPPSAPLPTFTPSATRTAALPSPPNPGTATPTLVAATPTPTPVAATPALPTNTPAAPSATPTPNAPTATPTLPPAATPTPTASPAGSPPTATPTNTAAAPTNTPVPPTATATPATAPSATPTPTAPPTFTPTPLPAPVVLAISPNQAVNTGTVSVVITGTNFVSGLSATLRDAFTYTISISSSTPTNIFGLAPAGVFSGTYNLRVTNPDAQFGQLAQAYTATNPAPRITAITPTVGFTNSATPVTITGDNFVAPAAGALDGFALTNVTYISSTQLTAVAPSNVMPTGLFSLTITNPGPTAPAGALPNAFTVASPPRNLRAAGGDGLVSLGWEGSTPPPQAYEVQVTTNITSPTWTPLPLTTTNFTYHQPATNGTTYWYRVRAHYPGGIFSGFSNTASAIPATIAVTTPVTVTCSPTGVINCGPDALLIDAQPPPITAGLTLVTDTGVITLDYGPGEGIIDGAGYDLVYYERPNTLSGTQIIFLDYSRIQVSPDGVVWTTVFEWNGDPPPGQDVSNTNIACYGDDSCDWQPAPPGQEGERDDEPILAADLWPDEDGSPPPPWNTGIAIDLAGVAESGVRYRYVRFTRPPSGAPDQYTEVDAIYRLN